MNSNHHGKLAVAVLTLGASFFPALGRGQSRELIQFSQSGHSYMIYGPTVIRDNMSIGTLKEGVIYPLQGLPADKQQLDIKIVAGANKDYQQYLQTQSRTGPAQSSSCTAAMGAYYSDGSTWLPMTRADFGNERGESFKGMLKDMSRNPWNRRAGQTNTMILTNPAAHITVGPTAKFCMGVPVETSTDNIFIEIIDVKGDRRQVEMLLSTAKKDIAKRLYKVDVNRLSNTTIEVTPRGPLPPGQYIIAGTITSGISAYDFGVQ